MRLITAQEARKLRVNVLDDKLVESLNEKISDFAKIGNTVLIDLPTCLNQERILIEELKKNEFDAKIEDKHYLRITW